MKYRKFEKIMRNLNNGYKFWQHNNDEEGSEDYISDTPESHVVNINESGIRVEFPLKTKKEPLAIERIDQLKKWIESGRI